jgi:hypothetical protein
MAFRPGGATAVVLSGFIVVAGVIVLVLAGDSATGVVGGVLVAAGALLGGLNLMLLRRGR